VQPSSVEQVYPPLLAGRSVAVVHEWFGATGGSEAVFLSIAALVPHADRFVLWKDRDPETRGIQVRESWLGRTPLRRVKALALPVMPVTWRTLTRQRFDVVISSSHAFAHTVKAGGPDTRYLSYVHSPARYVWSPNFDGRGSNPLLGLPRRVLQGVDRRLSQHVHSYAANSVEVQRRIERYWRRDARVINPPVDVEFYGNAPAEHRAQDRRYLLGAGRWITYKNFDIMIEIANLARVPLVLAGSGPEEVRLRRAAAKATVSVTFEVRPTRDRLRELYWGARALLYPAHEDFGIIPVEAQACGTPVLGLRRGGLLETVVEGETGVLVDSVDPSRYASLVGAVDAFDVRAMQANSGRFSGAVFARRVATWIRDEST
jgi:glycosyltransferase involved in cell wall biosynthesis